MHPTTSHQIATLQATELRHRTDLRHAHAPARRTTDRHAASSVVRSCLLQAWTALTAVRGA